MARWRRHSLSVARPFVCGCLTSYTILRFHTPAHRTRRALLTHRALRLASPASTRRLCLRLGRDSGNITFFADGYSPFRDRLALHGVDRHTPISGLLVSSRNMPEVRLLSSTGITRRHQSYEPVRHPRQPSLLLTEFRLRATTSRRWGFPCSGRPPLPCMPAPLPRRNHWMLPLSRPTATAFPENQTGRLPQYPFRGLLSVHSRSGLHVG